MQTPIRRPSSGALKRIENTIQVVPSKKKMSKKKVSNYISPFIFIINPQFLDFIHEYGNFMDNQR
jgi:NDP-sugar pyrophosphorylase family protein